VAVCGSGHARGKWLQHTLNHLGRLPYGKAVSGLAGDNQMQLPQLPICAGAGAAAAYLLQGKGLVVWAAPIGFRVMAWGHSQIGMGTLMWRPGAWPVRPPAGAIACFCASVAPGFLLLFLVQHEPTQEQRSWLCSVRGASAPEAAHQKDKTWDARTGQHWAILLWAIRHTTHGASNMKWHRCKHGSAVHAM
jgi:hypothetical protein